VLVVGDEPLDLADLLADPLEDPRCGPNWRRIVVRRRLIARRVPIRTLALPVSVARIWIPSKASSVSLRASKAVATIASSTA
jgi:hypothetical protein